MNNDTFKTLLKGGAIWGFIALELVFFEVAGRYWSLSDSAFMDLDNMLLLLKQSAPIGIIAVGMMRERTTSERERRRTARGGARR